MICTHEGCHNRLTADWDADYGYCFDHGSIFIGEALDIPAKPRSQGPRTRQTLPPEKVTR